MRHPAQHGSFLLAEHEIDTFAEDARKYLSAQKLEPAEVTRLCLAAEEVLLNWRAAVGGDGRCQYQMKRRLGRTVLVLSICGLPVNPLADAEDGGAILRRLGLSPTYEYIHGENRVTLSPRPQGRSPLLSLLLAIGSAILARILLSLFPAAVAGFAIDSVARPLESAFVRVLGMIAVPFLMLTFVQGVIEIGDLNVFMRIGKRLFGLFFAVMFLLAAGALAVALVAFPSAASGVAAVGNVFDTLARLLLDIIPANFIEPFASGNMLQVLFIAFLLGIAALTLKDNMPSFTSLVAELQALLQWLLSLLAKLVPAYIALSFLSFLSASSFADIGDMLRTVLLTSALCLVMSVAFVLLTSRATKRSFSQTVRAASAAWLTAFGTSSSTAAFPVALKSCDEEWRLEPRLSRFGLTLGIVLFKPASVIDAVITSFFAASMVGAPVTLSFVLVLLVSSVILSSATPAVPGGGMVRCTALMALLGINIEVVGVIITINMLLDPLYTATNVSLLEMLMAMQGGRKGKAAHDRAVDLENA